MRVTQSMITANSLRNLTKNYSKLGTINEQITSQKKFAKPSDDPVAAVSAMGYRSDLNRVEQYQENISTVSSWLDSTDDALQSTNDVLQSIRELLVKASNGTNDLEERVYIADEIEQLKNEIISLGDTQIGGKFIFGGTKTDEAPSANGYTGSGIINVEVFNSIELPLNIEGSSVFTGLIAERTVTDANGVTTTQDSLLQSIIDGLKNPNTSEAEISGYIDDIDSQMSNVLSKVSIVGARQNRVELMSDRLDSQKIIATRIMSDNEDVDMEELAIHLTAAESVLQAALSTTAKIIQPSLVDFLR